MATPPNATDESEEDEEEETKRETSEENIPDHLSLTSKKVRQFGVNEQYERKARNVMLKINNFPEIITANRAGELMVNGQAVLTPTLHHYFQSVFSRNQDL